ncbi:MAG: DNA recombination/repair protein RecA, partial [Chloroflexi bacterium]|nr:DNA recombination/repair protein RecA [Chloroflexota bacterium]
MGSKKQRLDQTVSAIQARWGSRALRKPAPQAPNAIPRIPTCFPSLDELTGGLPRGGITELLGAPTAGATTLALKAVAQAQAG